MNSKALIIFYALLFIFFQSVSAQSSKKIKTNGKSFKHTERADRIPSTRDICPETTYRSIDGTCNNVSELERIEWGATDIALDRSMLPEYGDTDHYNAMGGEDRPTPRLISNAICNQTEPTPSMTGLSSFVFTWGQFIDHDIVLTPEGESEYEPINLPSNEPLFTESIPFFRSEIQEDTGTDNYREQSNLISSWIDGSNVYGSDEDRANWLRSFDRGKLKTSSSNLLPFNTITGEYESAIDPNAPSMAGDGDGTIKTFVAGDVRAAEQPGLTSLHTLFVRYHNSICDRLFDQGQRNDEEIYQKARKEVGAIIQSITYNEFLPALGIRLNRTHGYKHNLKPDISNIFAAAAYRLGHTMVTDELLLKNQECQDIEDGSVSLLEGFFNVEVLRTYNIDPILNGLAIQVQNEVDTKIIDNLRNFLFGDPNSPVVFGLDLASLNIQRGRDHGLPDYNEVRKHYTGREAINYRDITRNTELKQALESTYPDINNIDLWVGLLAEDKQRGSSVGPTLHAILKSQFEKLRDGDRYFYKHDHFLPMQEKRRIERISLSDVITEVTNINQIQHNVFIARECGAQTSFRSDLKPESNSFEIELFPNPAINEIRIKINSDEVGSSLVEIFDSAGNLKMKTQVTNSEEAINISQLVSGVYGVRITKGAIVKALKFVKAE